MRAATCLATLFALAATAPAFAAKVTVPMALATAEGKGAEVGTVTLSDSAKGVSIAGKSVV